MKFRTLDDNWDWNIGKGRQDFSSDSLAVAYSIKTKILSWYRDCFFNMETGIDFEETFDKLNLFLSLNILLVLLALHLFCTSYIILKMIS